jgi:hypothetical protein
MKKERLLGILLIIVAVLVLPGFALGNQYYWLALDFVVLLVCGGGGIWLLAHKQP